MRRFRAASAALEHLQRQFEKSSSPWRQRPERASECIGLFFTRTIVESLGLKWAGSLAPGSVAKRNDRSFVPR